MKKMLCYFLLCAVVLGLIAGCISLPPVSTPTEPSSSVLLQTPTNGQTTQPTTQNNQQTNPGPTGPQQTTPGPTEPEFELKPLPTVEREKTGLLVEYDPNRELYILTNKNEIIYANNWGNNSYSFTIYSKKPLDVNSISVKLPISYYYSTTVRQRELGGVNQYALDKLDERSYYADNSFSYPLYLAYRGKDFRKLAELYDKYMQLQELNQQHFTMWQNNQITREQYDLLKAPYEVAKEEYYAYCDAEWEDYLALTKQDLPQFYAYTVSISFTDLSNIGADWEHEESFTQIEVTIGDETYVQDIGKITLIEDWELPAQLDWKVGFTGIAGTLGSINGPSLYNDETHCLEMLYHYTADRYELLEELVMLNPTQTVERVWLRIRPKGGSTVVVEWDMSEPYEIFPGDDVTVYASYRDENMNTLGYHTVTASYLLCTSDGESYCRFAYCDTNTCESDYLAYAILFDGLDLESYYWDFYYLIYEPWRLDPEATPMR